MKPLIFTAGVLSLCIAQVGCAASNGGGHVVGNPIISESASTKMKLDDSTCACAKDPKAKDCACATATKTSTSTSTSTAAPVKK